MAESRVISVRIPDEILKAIDEAAEQKYPVRGKATPNRSQFILDAVEFYLAHEQQEATVSDTVVDEVVEEKVSTAIAPLVKEIEELKARLGKSRIAA